MEFIFGMKLFFGELIMSRDTLVNWAISDEKGIVFSIVIDAFLYLRGWFMIMISMCVQS